MQVVNTIKLSEDMVTFLIYHPLTGKYVIEKG